MRNQKQNLLTFTTRFYCTVVPGHARVAIVTRNTLFAMASAVLFVAICIWYGAVCITSTFNAIFVPVLPVAVLKVRLIKNNGARYKG